MRFPWWPSWIGHSHPSPQSEAPESSALLGVGNLAWESFKFWCNPVTLGGSSAPGLAEHQAVGLVAQENAESWFDCEALGDGGSAFGCFQLHSDRCEAVLRGIGIDLRTLPDHRTQLMAAWWELLHPEHGALAHIRECTNAYSAGAVASKYWERPGAPAQEQYRGSLAILWLYRLGTKS